MEGIRNWAMTVCFAVATAGFISMLAPKNQTGKVLKLTLSVFILLSFLSPLSSCKRWEPELESNEALEESRQIADKIGKINENYVYQSLKTNIHVLIEEGMADLGVVPSSIEVEVSQEEDPPKIYAQVEMDEVYVSASEAVKNKLEELGIEGTVVLTSSEVENG